MKQNSKWLSLLSLAAAGHALADWPNFRGPRHDGVSDEKGFRTAWTEKIPFVWEREAGPAFSSFACVGDRVYTCGTVDKQQTLFGLNAKTGDILWQRPFEEEYRERQGGDGTRATPTVYDGRVYILGARGLLLCVDAESGSELWRKRFHHVPQWGYSGSVLIEGDLAIVSAGGKEGALLALDRKTGQQRWLCGENAAGYATPYPFTFQGKRYVVGFAGDAAILAELTTGREVLRIPWKTDYEVNAASPIYHEGYLYLGSGYDTGSAVLKLRSDGDRLAAETVWQSKVLMPKFQSPILYEGKLYCSDQKALVCVDFLTGKEHWRKPRIRNGTLIVADRHLLLLTEEGHLQIARAVPDDFVPTTDAALLSGRCWTVPVLHQGKLYARGLERLVCFDLRGSGLPNAP